MVERECKGSQSDKTPENAKSPAIRCRFLDSTARGARLPVLGPKAHRAGRGRSRNRVVVLLDAVDWSAVLAALCGERGVQTGEELLRGHQTQISAGWGDGNGRDNLARHCEAMKTTSVFAVVEL